LGTREVPAGSVIFPQSGGSRNGQIGRFKKADSPSQPVLRKQKNGKLVRLAAAREEFTGEGAPEVAAPDGNEKGGAEEKDSVETDTAPACPVKAVLKIQPESEFVESERGANTVQQRHEAAGKKRAAPSPSADLHQPAETDGEKDKDSPDQMMDVGAADYDVMKRADIALGGEGSEAREREGGKESDSSEEEAPPGAIANMLVQEATDAGVIQEQKDERSSEDDGNGEEPGAIEHGGTPERVEYSVPGPGQVKEQLGAEESGIGVALGGAVVGSPPLTPGAGVVAQSGAGDAAKSGINEASRGGIERIVVEKIEQVGNDAHALVGGEHAGFGQADRGAFADLPGGVAAQDIKKRVDGGVGAESRKAFDGPKASRFLGIAHIVKERGENRARFDATIAESAEAPEIPRAVRRAGAQLLRQVFDALRRLAEPVCGEVDFHGGVANAQVVGSKGFAD